MCRMLVLALVAMLVPAAAQAGPCGDELARFEQKVRVESRKPSAGPTAKQTTGAQLHRQPTPQSVREGEEQAQAAFAAATARARAADAAGDQPACQKALGEMKDMFDPM